jgi:hypothetical protein
MFSYEVDTTCGTLGCDVDPFEELKALYPDIEEPPDGTSPTRQFRRQLTWFDLNAVPSSLAQECQGQTANRVTEDTPIDPVSTTKGQAMKPAAKESIRASPSHQCEETFSPR